MATRYRRNGIDRRNLGPILKQIAEAAVRGGEVVCSNSNVEADHVHLLIALPPIWCCIRVVGHISVLKQDSNRTIQSNGGALHHQPNAKAFPAGALGAKLR